MLNIYYVGCELGVQWDELFDKAWTGRVKFFYEKNLMNNIETRDARLNKSFTPISFIVQSISQKSGNKERRQIMIAFEWINRFNQSCDICIISLISSRFVSHQHDKHNFSTQISSCTFISTLSDFHVRNGTVCDSEDVSRRSYKFLLVISKHVPNRSESKVIKNYRLLSVGSSTCPLIPINNLISKRLSDRIKLMAVKFWKWW